MNISIPIIQTNIYQVQILDFQIQVIQKYKLCFRSDNLIPKLILCTLWHVEIMCRYDD